MVERVPPGSMSGDGQRVWNASLVNVVVRLETVRGTECPHRERLVGVEELRHERYGSRRVVPVVFGDQVNFTGLAVDVLERALTTVVVKNRDHALSVVVVRRVVA